MLRALFERDIVPDVLVGDLGGRVQRLGHRGMPSLAGVERLVETWESLRGEEVFPGGRLSRAWNLLTRDDHLFDNEGLRALIAKGDTPKTFDELKVPLRVVACDLDTGEEVVFAAGPLEPALLASTALPGLFPPIRHDGRVLVDGAVVDTVPLSHALAGPVDRVYVLNIAGELLQPLLALPDRRRHPRVRDQPQAALRARAAERARERRGRGDDRRRSTTARSPTSPIRRPLIDAGVPARRTVARRRRRREEQAPHPPPPLVAPLRAARPARSLTAAQDTRARGASARWRAPRLATAHLVAASRATKSLFTT